MDIDAQKRAAGEAAIAFVEDNTIVGVGTGSSVKYFIDALGKIKQRIDGAVSSSEQSSKLLRELGIPVLDPNAVGTIGLYVDGADECDPRRCLIKGGGAALTREKILAAVAKKFVCIVDPVGLEERINQIVGVVTVGLVARRPADVVLIGADDQL